MINLNSYCEVNYIFSYSINMAIKTSKPHFEDNLINCLNNEARFFLEPKFSKQRQYEALRTYFGENLPVTTISRRSG